MIDWKMFKEACVFAFFVMLASVLISIPFSLLVWFIVRMFLS